MPTHKRQQIREAVQARLVGATSAGSRVFKTRLAPLRTVELPALNVYTDQDVVDVRSANTSPRRLHRELQVLVEGWVRLSENVDDALDSLALEVEKAVHQDETFGGKCVDCLLTTTEVAEKIDGDRPMGAIRLTFSAFYETLAPDPDDAPLGTLEDLSTVVTNYDVNSQVITPDEAQDQIDNLET